MNRFVVPFAWVLSLLAMTATAFAGERAYIDRRCSSSIRYEALRAGADCFNPPRDYTPHSGYGMQPRHWWWTMRRRS